MEQAFTRKCYVENTLIAECQVLKRLNVENATEKLKPLSIVFFSCTSLSTHVQNITKQFKLIIKLCLNYKLHKHDTERHSLLISKMVSTFGLVQMCLNRVVLSSPSRARAIKKYQLEPEGGGGVRPGSNLAISARVMNLKNFKCVFLKKQVFKVPT